MVDAAEIWKQGIGNVFL